ncbi:TPA: hypothetical protein ACPWPS_001285, partial [Pseudomonas aeruginosa]
GHQEEAADEIERLRDWNDHLNNTVLPNILNPTFLMLMKGGERLLDLCTKDGEFIGVSLNDMKDVFDWMVTHARIAPDQAALAQPSPVRSSLLINGYQLRAALDFIAPDGTAEQLKSEACIEWRQQDADFLEAGLYAFCAEYPEEGGVLLDEEPTTAQPSPLQSDQAEAERPEVVAVRYEDGTILSAEECGIALEVCAKVQTPLMTVAQHERIVGALRAELETERMRLAGCGVAALGYFDGCVDAYKSASLSDVLRLRADCDAALARVAELTATRNRYGVDAHYFNKNLQRILRDFESFTPDELARSLIILAKVADEKVVAQAQHSVPELLEWAVGRWHAEVSLRPLINVHRRALDDTWRQVIRRLGGDTGLLCGPSHDELLAAAPGKEGNDD